MSQQIQARKEIEAALIAKAQAEPAFRQALLKDANAAIEKELSVKLPAGSELKVVEETATTNYLVLPAATDDELSDADLENVAGGFFGLPFAAMGLQLRSITQDTTVNKAKTADKAYKAMDDYIKG